MPTIGSTPRPAYVYDAQTDTWVPVGVTPHTHTSAISDVTGLQDSLDSKALATSVPANVAGKNAVINGGFDIWQRGTSATSSSGVMGTTFLADRWSAYYYGGGNTANYTMSQQPQTPGAISGYEAPFFMRHAFPAGNSGTYWEFLTKIEDVRTLAGQTITISFWAKSTGTVNPSIELQQNFGTGGSTAVYSYPGGPSLTSAWTRYSFTTTLGSVSGKTIGAGSFLQFKLYLGPSGSAITAFNFDMAGVQIEAGSVATPFSRTAGTIQGERQISNPYYYRQTAPNPYSNFGVGFAVNTTSTRITIPLPAPMRITPSTTIEYANLALYDGVTIIPITSLTMAETNTQTPSLNATVASGLTQFRPYSLISNNSTSAYLALIAEL